MAVHTIAIVPFMIPTEVHLVRPPGRRQDGFKPQGGLRLSELSRAAVEALCDEFTRGVLTEYESQVKQGLNYE